MIRVLTLALLLSACGRTPEGVQAPVAPTMGTNHGGEIVLYNSETVEVRRQGSFRDDTAYSNYRSVYVVTDKRTGQQSIGLSGVGLSEPGAHLVGKVRREDER